MAEDRDQYIFGPVECDCTNPAHGGKLWMCDTEMCKHNQETIRPNIRQRSLFPDETWDDGYWPN